MNHELPPTFIRYASDILADSVKGLSGPKIVSETASYAVEYDVHLPHSTYPFDAPNKRTALYDNLMKFSPQQQYRIIKELCDHRSLPPEKSPELKELKIRLITRYSHLNSGGVPSEINETLIEETKHWLAGYTDVLVLYEGALEKFENGVFHRNLLDDLRLALEMLLQSVFQNKKSLENQIPEIGKHIKSKSGSVELSNMFVKLIDYYSKYQNSYIKHDDAVIEQEIEFIFEITSSFMKHLIRL